MKTSCLLCRSDELTPLLDVGLQPISNRFLRTPDEAEDRFPIALRQCAACALVQIDTPVPARALVPPTLHFLSWWLFSANRPLLDGGGFAPHWLADLMALPVYAAGCFAAALSRRICSRGSSTAICAPGGSTCIRT